MNYPPTWDFNKHGKILEGTYIAAFHGVGRFNNTLYAIKDKSGKTWTIWGSSNIKKVLQLRPFGKKVRIQFLGKKKQGKKNFWVLDFKVNIGKGNEDATTANDRGPRKNNRKLAASHISSPQQVTRPLLVVGGGHVIGSAAKIKAKKQKTTAGRRLSVREELPSLKVSTYYDPLSIPVPVPPAALKKAAAVRLPLPSPAYLKAIKERAG